MTPRLPSPRRALLTCWLLPLALLLSMPSIACREDAPARLTPDSGADLTSLDADPALADASSDADASDRGDDDIDGGDELDLFGPDQHDGMSGSGLEPLPDLESYRECAPFALRGPHRVGLLDLSVDGIEASVFYPAELTEGGERASYQLERWLPEEAQGKIPPGAVEPFEMDAYRDVPIDRAQRWPVVVFSHGFAGYRLQSSFLLTHLASWGFVVVSAEHPGRGLAAVLNGALADGDDARIVSAMLDELKRLDESQEQEALFSGALDLERVAMTGHSAGGGATIRLGLSDPERFKTLIGYTPAVKGFSDNTFLEPISQRALLMSGTRDALTTSQDTATYAESLDVAPWRHVVIKGAGHLAFTDICVIGREQGGILQIAKRHGVTVPILVEALASDGCRKADLRAEIAWPIIGHFSVTELNEALKSTELPVSAEEAVACFGDLIAQYDASP